VRILKLRGLLVCGLVLGISVTNSSVVASAATYGDNNGASTATVDGTVIFEKDSGPSKPVDPSDPDIEVDPGGENPNTTGSELWITYASELDFGVNSKSDTIFYAAADQIADGTGGTKPITPFVSIKDTRGSDRQGWNVTAKLDDEFKDSKGNSLEGATLTFSDLFSGDATMTHAPSTHAGSVIIGTLAEADIASADKDHGSGSWAIGLGKLNANGTHTTGVTLSVPQDSVKNTDTYTTSITYTLSVAP
jgi:hypothetical protein